MRLWIGILLLACVVTGCGRESYGETGPISIYGGCDEVPSNGHYLGDNGHCYTFHTGPVTRSQAEIACTEIGGNLLELSTSEEEQEVLDGLGLDEPVWSGMAWLFNTWGWISGESLLYSNWEADPAMEGWGGALTLPDGRWRQVDVEETHAFACELGWTRSGDNEIAVFGLGQTWSLARARCVSLFADLAVLKTAAELELARPLSGRHPWIGLHDPELDGFEWLDGSSVASGLWAGNQPNGDASCGLYDPTSGLHDTGCTNARSFLCQRPASE